MSEAASMVAIVNPKAAAGKTLRAWDEFAREITARIAPIDTLLTEAPGHATELTRRALETGAETVLAVGGDGTANEVANGFFSNDRLVAPSARMAYLPIGTGGDFQRSLGLPEDPVGVAEMLAWGRVFRMDVGKIRLVGDDDEEVLRYFVNLTSFGMGGDVSVKAKNNFWSGRHGTIAFLYATFAVFLRYRGKNVTLRFDDSDERRDFNVTNVAVGNGRFHGGGMHPCPRAVLNDGLFEVTTIDRLSMFELIRDLPILYSDDVYQHPKVRHFRAAKVVAESDDLTRVEVDGEALGRLPLEATILPQALPLLLQRGNPLLQPQ